MNFYRLKDNINFPNRWYLADVIDFNGWDFHQPSCIIPKQNIKIELNLAGKELDFTNTDITNLPIVSRKVRDVLKSEKGVRFIPATIQNNSTKTEYYILLVDNMIDCINEEKSDYTTYKINDPVRPDLAGNYSNFIRLVINPVDEFNIFRIKKYKFAIIINEEIKIKLEKIGALGLSFFLVS